MSSAHRHIRLVSHINTTVQVTFTIIQLYNHAYTCTHTHIQYIHTYTYTYIHELYIIHTYMYTYMYTYIHTYMHAYIHTNIHTYIHTYSVWWCRLRMMWGRLWMGVAVCTWNPEQAVPAVQSVFNACALRVCLWSSETFACEILCGKLPSLACLMC